MNCCGKHQHEGSKRAGRPPAVLRGFVIAVFMIGGGYYLWAQHSAHILRFLPFLIFLLCPLMHLFHGHENHEGHSDKSSDERLK
jgi:hypothetical protein